MAFEYLRSEEVGDGAWRLRELRRGSRSGNDSSRRDDGGHLDTGGPTFSAGREELDLGFVQLDAELRRMTAATSALRESELGVAYLEQLPMRT